VDLKLRKIKISDKKYFTRLGQFRKVGIKKYPKNKNLPQTLKMALY
jgi:hypothetical protein